MICCTVLTIFIICILWTGKSNRNENEHLNEYMNVYSKNGIGGFYIDPSHYQQGTLIGTRMISELNGDAPSSIITLIGTDDGILFWTIKGEYTDKENGKILVDFTPKNGPKISATYSASNGIITWQDGNKWTKSSVNNI